MIVRRVLVPALLLWFAAAPLLADDVDDLVRAEMRRQRIPGLSLAITRAGVVVKAAGYGLANVELDVAATPDTVFQSGSVGKQFTATAVMMLVEAGRLSLDDPITKHLAGAPGSWRPIRVRHLLSHTSGIKDWDAPEIDYRKDYTEDELLKLAASLPLDFAPGSQWSYSNTGYVMLGILVHRLSGQFYGDFLTQRVFAPLGMTSTRVISEADIVPRRAAGYRLEKGALKNQEWVSPSLNTTADGSLYLTALDLARWEAAQAGTTLLPRPLLEQMWTPVRLLNGASYPYGFGWAIGEQRGRPTIEHGGSWQGFRSAIARYPEQRLGVIVLSNLAQAQPERIAHAIAGVVEPALRLPDPRAPGPEPQPAVAGTLRQVLAAWGRGEPQARMAPGLRDAHAGTAREKASRKQTAERVAKLTSFSFLAEDDVRGRGLERRGTAVERIFHYALVAGDETFVYRFYLDGAGQVADFTAERDPG